jgi:hypothetical protein
MIRKTMALAMVVAAGIAIATSWPDIKRFIKIKQLSGEQAHPENVPAEGRTSYPNRHEAGAPDGTGDFDSARRGGPVHT